VLAGDDADVDRRVEAQDRLAQADVLRDDI
jgi:hypothetical protein